MEWRRAVLCAERFERDTALSVDSLRLSIERLKSLKRCGKLREAKKEEINAERSAKELFRSLQPVLDVQAELSDPEDQHRFWERIKPTKSKIEEVVQELKIESNNPSASYFDTDEERRERREEPKLIQKEVTLDVQDYYRKVVEEAQVHQQIAQDIGEIEMLMHDLEDIVRTQGETVDSIESHVENAANSVKGGERQLKKAVVLKTASYTAAGAAVGAAALSAPAGAFVGLSAAVVAGIGGAVAGAFGGRFVKRKIREED